jgi:hypothetical protein
VIRTRNKPPGKPWRTYPNNSGLEKAKQLFHELWDTGANMTGEVRLVCPKNNKHNVWLESPGLVDVLSMILFGPPKDTRSTDRISPKQYACFFGKFR